MSTDVQATSQNNVESEGGFMAPFNLQDLKVAESVKGAHSLTVAF